MQRRREPRLSHHTLKASLVMIPIAAGMLWVHNAIVSPPKPTPIHAEVPDWYHLEFKASALGGSIKVDIPGELYLEALNTPHTTWSQRQKSLYAPDHPVLEDLAQQILAIPATQLDVGVSAPPDFERIRQFVAANADYTEDPGAGHLKHPLAVLVEGGLNCDTQGCTNQLGGDCEDLANFSLSLMRYTGRHAGAIDEPDHVAYGVGLRPGEKTPWVNVTQVDQAFTSLLDRQPELKSWSMARLQAAYPDLFTPIHVGQAATFEHDGITYFAVEATATNPWNLKTEVDMMWPFQPLF